jgi:hypothetical protein
MANTERKIHRGVQIGAKTYVPGMEDELDTALSPEDAARLVEQGSLEGKWSGKHEPKADSPKADHKGGKKE